MTFEPSQIELKLPRMSTLEKCYLLESSLIKFGLDGRTNLLHLSGGEKRKLSLASEVKYSLISRRIKSVNHFFLLLPQLLTKPRILFCDEPTSGLDSFSAFAMMNTLRELAGYVNEPRLFQKPPKQSRIVLFSIHQPTSDIFHLFTNVILMNAGRIIFHGTVQEAETLFNSIRLPCPPRYNPAEFYVNRISNPNVADDIVKYVGDAKTFDNSLNSSNNSSESREDDKAASGSKVSWMRQVVLLSHRATLNFLHYPKHYLIELLILFVSCIDFFFLRHSIGISCSQIFALIITVVYSGVSFDSPSAVQDIKGFLLILATEVLFSFVYAVFILFYEVLPLLRKETGNRLYSLSAYYVSIVLLMVSGLASLLFRLCKVNLVSDSTSDIRDFYVYGDNLLLNRYRS